MNLRKQNLSDMGKASLNKERGNSLFQSPLNKVISLLRRLYLIGSHKHGESLGQYPGDGQRKYFEGYRPINVDTKCE